MEHWWAAHLSPFLLPLDPQMERVSIFCDAWPVRRQIYGYLLPLRRGTNLYRFVVEDYGELLAQPRTLLGELTVLP